MKKRFQIFGIHSKYGIVQILPYTSGKIPMGEKSNPGRFETYHQAEEAFENAIEFFVRHEAFRDFLQPNNLSTIFNSVLILETITR